MWENCEVTLPVIIDILNLIVLSLTLGAVVWYAVITNKMQKAAANQSIELVRQRRLSNLPSFIADIKHKNGDDYLELSNIGKGIAINIIIERTEIRFPTLESGYIEFEKVLMLKAGEGAFVESREFHLSNSETGNPNTLTFLSEYAHYDADVNIRFQDVEGTKYIQTLKLGKSGYEHGFVRLDEENN